MAGDVPSIPPRLHFVWIGSKLEWVHVWAMKSAAMHSQCEEIILHHVDPLHYDAPLAALLNTPRVKLKQVNPRILLTDVGRALHIGTKLSEAYENVSSPVALSNILRAAVLYAQGGVYLDLDTITVKSLRPLLAVPEFVGHEFTAWPHYVYQSLPLRCKSVALSGVRDLLRRLPKGHLVFRRISGHYYLAVNNAILGSASGGVLIAHYLKAMAAIPTTQVQLRYVFGTHLLQKIVEGFDQTSLTIHPPDVFYLMPPEISEHWFRHQSHVDLDKVLQPDTRIVHWYASIRTKHLVPQLTPDYIDNHQQTQLFSALVRQYAQTDTCLPQHQNQPASRPDRDAV
ncbi:MAG: glycosyl transferase [Myxococcales bacterium]|nr:glycosyl transferase [Myxococcales bacterium]